MRGKKKRLNRGSSLVSAIVAFAILMIAVSMFTTAMYTAATLTNEAEQLRARTDNAMEQYYLSSPEETPLLADGKIYFSDPMGNGFYVEGNVYRSKIDDFIIYHFK